MAPRGPRSIPWGSYPHAADIDRIVAIGNDTARNREITQSYHDLSVATAGLLGSKDASWTAFAVWASNTAGESIRHEALPGPVLRLLDRDEEAQQALTGLEALLQRFRIPIPSLLQELIDAGNDTLDEVRLGVAAGNREVFNEVARESARFIETFDGEPALDPGKLRAYLAQFSPEQAPLRQAFGAYAHAVFETDADKRSEWVLLGNLLIGYHEQGALTGHIGRAMDAPVNEALRDVVVSRVSARVERLPPGGREAVRAALLQSGLLERALQPLVGTVAKALRTAATGQVMTLKMPTETVRLGQDLPARGADFPPALRTIDNPQLAALIARIDPDPASLRGTGARDWQSFDQRMHFIGDLFRSRQQEPSLFDPPFGERGAYGVVG